MALSKYWLTHIKDWQRSGLSQVAYCRQHDLNANSFTGRLSEFRKQESIASAELIPIKVKVDEEVPLPHVLILTVQGCRLELPTTISAQWLAELLRCLS